MPCTSMVATATDPTCCRLTDPPNGTVTVSVEEVVYVGSADNTSAAFSVFPLELTFDSTNYTQNQTVLVTKSERRCWSSCSMQAVNGGEIVTSSKILSGCPNMLAVFDAPPGVSFRFGLVLNAVSSSAEDPAFQSMPVKVGGTCETKRP